MYNLVESCMGLVTYHISQSEVVAITIKADDVCP